ncbi:vacuolar protein sorting-associated protein 18 homolog [Nilaparvata lugens]|uniref:vacuolar protein sorting-associated protein 18 homolog n=1 Tax=Nilaparvata lugens TaxID=108931 RepID=UPI00193D6129|nr:vacuolar protein sorting-associated protein 18 homolog [Nilaparvata lugens]XP_039289672.1 vacuolar protein sorting-associated protein 18 homolog [Nilaparvata lugens]
MTSLFDQYEQESQRSRDPVALPSSSDMGVGMGYIDMTVADDVPIFAKQTVNFKPTHRVTHLAVNNEVLVITMANNQLLRINFQKSAHSGQKAGQGPQVEEITIPSSSQYLKLIGLYLDPTGSHVLLSMARRGDQSTTSELLYLSANSNKIKQTSKLRAHEVTAVAWNEACEPGEPTTRPILLGTSRGVILETTLSADSDRKFQGSVEQYCSQLFDVGKGSHCPITGISFNRITGTDKYLILVVTWSRLYQFVGSVANADEPMRALALQHIFNVYLSIPETYIEMTSNKNACLQMYYSKPKTMPKHFGWLVDDGLFIGQIDAEQKTSGEEEQQRVGVMSGQDVVRYPTGGGVPQAFVLTEFHALLLYADHVTGISTLNQATVFDDFYNESHGKLVNIAKDSVKGTIWVIAERAIFKYRVTREERNVWQIHMEKGDYNKAKSYCADNPLHMDIILVKQADELFQTEQYEQSALLYAETQSSFEEVALKFLQVWQIEALKIFLKKKLEMLKPSEKTQITMIVMWVVELHLNQLGNLRNEGKEHSTQFRAVQDDLDAFLQLPVVSDSVKNNRGAVYDLMSSHDDKHNLIRLTIANKDFERVIRLHINKGEFIKALEILKSQNLRDLYYTFTPALLPAIPRPTVSALIEQGRHLNPSKLLPALITTQTDQTTINEIIRYLEFCVGQINCQEQAVHNYLLSLYVKHKPDRLMRYLAMQGQEASMVNYDVRYALRLCREQGGCTEACVQLSALLGLWEAAVDLALSVSVDLAQQTVAMAVARTDTTKKLWLKIAQHVVREKNDIQQAMQFLQRCELLKIEDILPFFSDFVTIDHFKDAICSSLQEYNQHIQDLKDEIEDTTKSAEVLRKEIQEFRKRYDIIEPSDTCSSCGIQLLMRPFYFFPCSHRFHGDCLVTELDSLLPDTQRHRLLELQKQLQSVGAGGGGGGGVASDAVSTGSANRSLSLRDQLKSEIDAIVASECLYCGDLIIQNIDSPFIEDKDYERIRREWE